MVGGWNHICPVAVEQIAREMDQSPNNRIHADSKNRRSFLALLFAAGDAKRSAGWSRWAKSINKEGEKK